MSLIAHSDTPRVADLLKPKNTTQGKKEKEKKKPEPFHNWFMYLCLELEEELEHLSSISACARVSANTHAPHVYPCACIRGEKQYGMNILG